MDPKRDAVHLPGDRALSFIEKADRLSSAFGSGRKKRSVNSRLQSRVDVDILQSTIGLVAGKAVDSGVLEKHAAAASESDELKLIPPCNKEADTPMEVYRLKDLISDSTMDALSEGAAVFTESTREERSQWAVDKTYCQFILKKLSHLPLADPARTNKAKRLLYLHYMISLFHRNFNKLNRKDLFPRDWPGVCKQSLRESYVGETGGVDGRRRIFMSDRHKDRLAAHILVLCLILNEYELPLTDMMAEFKFPEQKMSYLMQTMGCRVKVRKQDSVRVVVAHLEIPLVFPDPRPLIKNKRRT